jgi:hypothetical protein
LLAHGRWFSAGTPVSSTTKNGRHDIAEILLKVALNTNNPGADPGFQARGAHLKKLRRAEEGANILGVFRVKNHYFTPKNHSFYNCGGRREKFWGISCEKSRFYAKKKHFFFQF